MPLPASGQITIKDVYEELYGTYTLGVSGQLSMHTMTTDFDMPTTLLTIENFYSKDAGPLVSRTIFPFLYNELNAKSSIVTIHPSDTLWTATPSDTWINVTENYVSNICEISCDNNIVGARAGTITITNPNNNRTQTINVTQESGYHIFVVPTLVEAGYSAEVAAVDVSVSPVPKYPNVTIHPTSADVELYPGTGWLSSYYDVMSGEFSIFISNSSQTRLANIILTHPDDPTSSSTITVKQTFHGGGVPDNAINATPSSFTLDDDPGDYSSTITIKPVGQTPIITKDQTWIYNVSYSSNILDFSVYKNPDPDAGRSGIITLTHPLDGAVTKTISIYQNPAFT